VKYVDPTGKIWEDPEEAERLKNNIDNRITSVKKAIAKKQAKLDKEDLSEKQAAKLEREISNDNDRISNLNTSKDDIDVLGADENNVYKLSQTNGGEHKVRQGSDGKVYIETSSDALSIHEITHVRQSLNAGGLEFSSNGELINATGYARQGSEQWYKAITGNEVEASKMQYSYDLSFPGRTSNLQGINVHSVGNIMNNGQPVYLLINKYSIFLRNQQKLLGK
jgi:hypothetical protein